MKWLKWLRAKLRRKSTQRGPRREFVYLDEVSVYSILASRQGAIPTELTETDSETLRSSIDGSVGADTPVGGAGLRSRLEGSRTRGTQVVRKANVQASFKDLVEIETGQMRIHDSIAEPSPAPRSLDELRRLRGKTEHLTAASDLVRGDLLELEVKLDAESIFQASLMLATMLGFFEEAPEFFTLEPAELSRVRGVNRVFDELLSGLVPIRGESTRYERIEIDGEEFLASKEMLEGLPEVELSRRPLYVVAVTESELFWRDLRRILFSDSKFFVMFRLSMSGLQDTWHPVKVVDLLQRFIPTVGNAIDEVGEEFLKGVTRGAAGVVGEPEERAAATQFAELIAQAGGTSWSGEDGSVVDVGTIDLDLSSVEKQRESLAPIVEQINGRIDPKLDRDRVADIRDQVMTQHGFRVSSKETSDFPAASKEAEPECLLDSEVVAIYW